MSSANRSLVNHYRYGTGAGISLAALLLWQLPEGHPETGLTLVIGFVLLLLIGGIFLVARGINDLIRNRNASKHAGVDAKRKRGTTPPDQRKAA